MLRNAYYNAIFECEYMSYDVKKSKSGGDASSTLPASNQDAINLGGDFNAQIEHVFTLLEKDDMPGVERVLSVLADQALAGECQFQDAAYIFGMLVIATNGPNGIELISRSIHGGLFSPKFSSYFGRLLCVFGEKGEQLRMLLQRHRLIPWAVAGFLGIERDFNNVEPWHYSRSMTQVFPKRQSDFGHVEDLIEKYVLPGWLPDVPLFGKTHTVLTLGSCFAQELRNYLAEQGLSADWLFVPPGLNNTFALRNFIEWCLTGKASTRAYWYDEVGQGGAVEWSADADYLAYKEVFRRVDGVILTVGLAEVWEDMETGGVFWRGVPKSIFDETKHVCRVSTVQENEENLSSIISLLHELNPTLPIIVTLSPIPLKATTGDKSCITVDTVSKSILRVAIDNIMGRRYSNVYYWPSFEIVRSLGPHLPYALFGEDGNTRHVDRKAVHMILKAFMRHYFSGID